MQRIEISDQPQNEDYMDPFADRILANIEPEIHRSLSPDQLIAFRNAIRKNRKPKKHFVSIQQSIKLPFIRVYYVFFADLTGEKKAAA